MLTPTHRLLVLALRHLNDEPEALRRAEMLEAAAELMPAHVGEKLSTTAAIIREADRAQLELSRLLTAPSADRSHTTTAARND